MYYIYPKIRLSTKYIEVNNWCFGSFILIVFGKLMNKKEQITLLKEKRRKVFHLDFFLASLFLVGSLGQVFIPNIAPYIGLTALILLYRKFLNVAHTPCPRCNEAFTTNSNLVLSLGENKCQNCGLEI